MTASRHSRLLADAGGASMRRRRLGVVVLALVSLVGFAARRGTGLQLEPATGPRVPDPLTPFSLLGLLRELESQNGLSSDQLGALGAEIAALERHFFQDDPLGNAPDLRRIAEDWAAKAD